MDKNAKIYSKENKHLVHRVSSFYYLFLINIFDYNDIINKRDILK